jgi:hypothetical protein
MFTQLPNLRNLPNFPTMSEELAHIVLATGNLVALTKLLHIGSSNAICGCRFCDIKGVYYLSISRCSISTNRARLSNAEAQNLLRHYATAFEEDRENIKVGWREHEFIDVTTIERCVGIVSMGSEDSTTKCVIDIEIINKL